jgi:hypothetical protein
MRRRNGEWGVEAMGVVRPLVMLVGGLLAGAILWRFLMLDDPAHAVQTWPGAGEGPTVVAGHQGGDGAR